MDKTILIKDYIYKKIAARAKEADFKTTDEYIEYILKQVVERLEEEKEEPEEVYSEEDEKKVKERLRALGYLD